MKRFLNYRGFLFLALGFVGGVLCAYALWRGKGYWLALAFGTAGTGALVGVILKNKKILLTFILIITALFCGFFQTNAGINEINRRVAYKNVTLRGIVTDNSFTPDENGYGKYFLRDVYIFDGEKTLELEGKVQARFSLKDISVGDEIIFSADVYPIALLSEGVQSYLIKNGVFYSCENVTGVLRSVGYATVPERVRDFVRQSMTENMSEVSSSVAVGLLIGDKAFMDDCLADAYKRTGVAHIFAVSGLHVGFVAGIFAFAVRKLRLKSILSLFVTIVPVLFYAWLCGFSPSVVRAAVMTFVGLFLNAIGAKSDMLSSVSFAMLIVLLINPFYLFDGGFQMSFAAVYGIAVFSAVKIRRLDENMNRFKKGILSSLLLSTGASLGTFPLVVHYYGLIPVFSLALNLVVIPLISVVFVLLWTGMLPFMKFLLAVPDFLIKAVNTAVGFVSELDFAVIPLRSFGAGAFVFLMILFVAGGFVNLTKKGRRVVCAGLCGIFLLCAVMCQFPPKGGFEIAMLDCRSATAVFVDDENRAVAVSSFEDYACVNEIKAFCAERGIKSFDAVVLEYDKLEPKYLLEGGNDSDVRVEKVYKMRGINDAEKDLIFSRGGVETADAFYGADDWEGMSFSPLVINGIPAGINVNFNGKNIFVSFNGSMAVLGAETAALYDGYVDAVLTDRAYFGLDRYFDCLLFTNEYTTDENFYSTKRLGNFTLRVLNDKMVLSV